ncbi:MAG: hypothetical protein Q7J68_00480 [Thermoplasmata archaeon]|nr:hypothetical protein [Thermoplasmata archaeon]
MNKELDDDDVFYGSGKSKAKKEPEKKSGVYGSEYKSSSSEPRQQEYSQPATDSQASEPERDIESEITETRREKAHAAEYHDIAVLRQRAAKHSAEAARLFKKYRFEEAAMVKYTQGANKARRKAEKYEQKAKDASAKADDKQANVQYLEGGKAERTRVKIAKLHAKSAKLKSKASSSMAHGAKLSQKAAAKREKAKAYHEQSKIEEAEAQNVNKRANKLQKTSS